MDGEVVVDSSVWSAVWLREPGWEGWQAALASAPTLRAAPFFRFEVANVLWKRRAVVPAAERDRLVAALFAVPVSDDFDGEDARATLELACQSGMTFYDMAFVALARRHGATLWTLDRRQAEAARAAGVGCRGSCE